MQLMPGQTLPRHMPGAGISARQLRCSALCRRNRRARGSRVPDAGLCRPARLSGRTRAYLSAGAGAVSHGGVRGKTWHQALKPNRQAPFHTTNRRPRSIRNARRRCFRSAPPRRGILPSGRPAPGSCHRRRPACCRSAIHCPIRSSCRPRRRHGGAHRHLQGCLKLGCPRYGRPISGALPIHRQAFNAGVAARAVHRPPGAETLDLRRQGGEQSRRAHQAIARTRPVIPGLLELTRLPEFQSIDQGDIHAVIFRAAKKIHR